MAEEFSGRALIAAIDAEKRTVWDRAAARMKEIEGERDSLLDRFDRAIAALEEDAGASTPGASPPKDPEPRKPDARRRRGGRTSTTPAAARKRREAILRCLTERGAPTSPRELERVLKIPVYALKGALARLCKEGKVVRTGHGRSTRYEVADVSPASAGPPSAARLRQSGTLQGRILATVETRGWASLDELVQAVEASREQVVEAVGALVREEELRMDRRNGRAVYVIWGTA